MFFPPDIQQVFPGISTNIFAMICFDGIDIQDGTVVYTSKLNTLSHSPSAFIIHFTIIKHGQQNQRIHYFDDSGDSQMMSVSFPLRFYSQG